MHKSGFINIIGQPNVGKSTLMNALIGERMSIITFKPQTTRHRIIGILSSDDYQLVFSDTPGVIQSPNYKMQEAMNRFVNASFDDADVILFVTDPFEEYPKDAPIIRRLQHVDAPIFLVINKIDLVSSNEIAQMIKSWNKLIPFKETIPISALKKDGITDLLQLVLQHTPEGPEYYPKDQLTDKPERFFVSEIIREKILLQYKQEIPYSTEVIVQSYKEGESRGGPIIRIEATIFVSRRTQKAIIIGKGGSAIKRLGTNARKDIEEFIGKKIFLELFVKVKDNWRDDERQLKHFGYQ